MRCYREMTRSEYKQKLKEVRKANQQKHWLLRIQREKNKYKKITKKQKQAISSKRYVAFVFLICLEIAAFAEIASLVLHDSAPLVSLVGIPVTLVPILLGYFSKSAKENTKGGIIYEQALRENTEQMDNNNNNNNYTEVQG